MFSQLFPARLRYSGLALAANLAGLIGGFMPALATGLLTGRATPPGAPRRCSRSSHWLSLAGSIAAARIIKADGRKAADE